MKQKKQSAAEKAMDCVKVVLLTRQASNWKIEQILKIWASYEKKVGHD